MLPFFYFILVLVSTGIAEDLSNANPRSVSINIAKISQDPIWRALLHYRGGRCYVVDPTFFLSDKTCNLEAELEALLDILQSGVVERIKDVMCRFPARVEFLLSHQGLEGRDFNVPPTCQELSDYNLRAPSDDISLVFAAENVSHPMSMMGHVFLAFYGKNSSGNPVSHAVSFYTSFRSYNPISIASDALFDGMPSYFSLVPLREQLYNYTKKEGRNVWEYVLHLSEYQKKLMRLHIWELRDAHSPYYFVGYNCATVVHFILSVASPVLANKSDLWVAPIDVVRDAQHFGLIESRSFHPSLDWRLRSFRAALGSEDASLTEFAVDNASADRLRSLPWGKDDHIRIEYAKALIDRGVGPKEKYQPIEEVLNKINSRLPLASYSVENLRDPLKAVGFPQFSLSINTIDGQTFSKVFLLPLSHILNDDHSNSASESSLQIGGISILQRWDSNNLLLDQFNLYSFDSFVPAGPSYERLSTRFKASIERQLNKDMDWFLAGVVSGGAGKTFEAGNDLRYYLIANLGLNHGDGNSFMSVWPEVGFSLYELLNMKTSMSYKFMCLYGGDTGCFNNLSATQSIFLTRSTMTFFKIESAWTPRDSWERFDLGVRVSF